MRRPGFNLHQHTGGRQYVSDRVYVGAGGLTHAVRARGALLVEAPPLAVTPAGCAGVGTRSTEQAASLN